MAQVSQAMQTMLKSNLIDWLNDWLPLLLQFRLVLL